MPIGVPKVSFRIPGNEDASWVDLYNRVYRQRLLFLGEDLNYENGNNIVGLIVFLSLEDPSQILYFFLNCPGGLIMPGIAVHDTMGAVLAEVRTVCVGVAASMGAFILVGGEITERLAFPHARVMIHQPSSTYCLDKTGECTLETNEVKSLHERIINDYAKRTGRSPWVIRLDMQLDGFMSATDALNYGLVDLVGVE